MINTHQDQWSRVKGRLRAEVGEDVFSSWFGRMDLEDVADETARMSVPTRFLKSWIQSHYAERVLACWQAEHASVQRVELSVRSTGMRSAPSKKASEAPVALPDPPVQKNGANGVHVSTSSEISIANDAIGG